MLGKVVLEIDNLLIFNFEIIALVKKMDIFIEQLLVGLGLKRQNTLVDILNSMVYMGNIFKVIFEELKVLFILGFAVILILFLKLKQPVIKTKIQYMRLMLIF